MSKLRATVGFCALVLFLAMTPYAYAQGSERVVKATGYLSVDGVKPNSKFKIGVKVEIAEGYHVNANIPTLDYLKPTGVRFEPSAGIRISQVEYPTAMAVQLEFAPETTLAVFENVSVISAEAVADENVKPGSGDLIAVLDVQACSSTACLAPSEIRVAIPLKFVASNAKTSEINADVFTLNALAGSMHSGQTAYTSNPSSLVEYKGDSSRSDPFASAVAGGTFSMLGIIFVSGLLLNLTPCVYPIIPITIGFFVNQSAGDKSRSSLGRAAAMASMYVLGMAVTYSLLGVIAAKSGGLFGAALQKPVVLIGLAILMVALSLSMFGVYEFRLPDSVNRLATKSTQNTSGMLGALIMGLTMGVVAAPCIGPFVLGLLVHVGTRGDAVYGFLLFFVLALGLGFPYLLLGTFSSALRALPRSGFWMVTIRKVFGVVLIGMALYFLSPLFADKARYVYIAFFAAAAVYFLVWEAGRTKPVQFGWGLRVLGLAAAVTAVVLALPRESAGEIAWQPFSEAALEMARKQGKGVIIDSSASWCMSCKELDEKTFSDNRIRSEAERFVPLKLDLTQVDSNSDGGRARERFKILGLPTIIFLDPTGREIPELRLEGFEKPDAFLNRMKKVGSRASAEGVPVATASSSGASTGSSAVDAAPEPEAAPPVVFSLLDGKKLDLTSLRGRVVLVDFWATWCLPCISEIPQFNQLKKDYGDKGIEIVAVSLDPEGAAKVTPFLKEHPMGYTQAIGDSEITRLFGVEESKLPVAILLDKRGRVRFRHVGITKKETFESEIQALLGE